MFNWPVSQSLGRMTEITVLAPIRKGLVPGERWTYEENVRTRLDNVAGRVAKGIPVDLAAVPSIHIGRVTVIRPEHYLLYSDVEGVEYQEPDEDSGEGGKGASGTFLGRKVPVQIDAYAQARIRGGARPLLSSFLLVQVAFDGDIEAYFRDIAVFVDEFDSIFENCEEYPSSRDFGKFWAWVKRYKLRPDLFYTLNPDTSAVRIRELERFKRRFDAFVASVRTPEGYTVESLEDAFDRFLRANAQIAEGFPAPGGTFPDDRTETGS